MPKPESANKQFLAEESSTQPQVQANMSQLEKKEQEIDWQHRSTVNRIKSEIWSDRVSFLQKVLTLAEEDEESKEVETPEVAKTVESPVEKAEDLVDNDKTEKPIATKSPEVASPLSTSKVNDDFTKTKDTVDDDEDDQKLEDEIIDQDFEGDDKDLGVKDLNDPDWAKESAKDARYRGLTDQEWAHRS